MSQLRVGDRYSRMHKGNCLPFVRLLRTPPGNGRGGEEEEKQFGEEANDSLKAALTGAQLWLPDSAAVLFPTSLPKNTEENEGWKKT